MRALAAVLALAASLAARGDFRTPARDDYPETWFHFIGGNISREGVTADLEAIAQAKIRGVHFFHGQFGGAWPHVERQIPCLSPEWDGLLAHVADESKRLGLRFTMQNCPGWSYAGGPWIAPSNAMRVLTFTTGERPAFTADQDYRTIVDVAFPTPLGAGEIHAPESADGTGYTAAEWLARATPGAKVEPRNVPSEAFPTCGVTYGFGKRVTVRSLTFSRARDLCWCWYSNPDMTISLSAECGGKMARVASWRLPPASWQDDSPFTLAVPETTSARFRLDFAFRSALHVDSIRFSAQAAPHNWESDAGYTNRNRMRDGDVAGDVRAFVDPAQVRVLEPGEGVPAGWTRLRIGHVNNLKTNAPAPKEATGWECDKLSPAGAEAHFAGYMGRLTAPGGPVAGKVDAMLVDSWECGFQNWTVGFDARFRSRWGYDMTPFWPALCGYVVKDRAATEAFLRDWRRLLSESIAENFYARLSALARARGMKLSFEVAAGEVFPADPLEYFKFADVPMCEFWLPIGVDSAFDGPNPNYTRACVSAAHVYGKRSVAAEAFTSCMTWDESPALLKEVGDAHLCEGVTRFAFHTYTHNPATDLPPPGTSFGEGNFGAPFLRGQTWWHAMPHFTDYLARCTTMLEAGAPANDVLLYLSDDIDRQPPRDIGLGPGLKADCVNRDALLGRLDVKDGQWTAPEGTRWHVLWIKDGTWLADDSRARIAELEKRGGRVCHGGPPDLPPDVDAGTNDIAWIHRRIDKGDAYFLAVRRNRPFDGEIAFRAEGVPFFYDPMTGERRAAAHDGNRVRVKLAGGASVFVVFERAAAEADFPADCLAEDAVAATQAWTLEIGGKTLPLANLVSWKDLPADDETRAFSGTATYRTTVDVPKRRGRCVLALGRVECVAAVKVNGKDAGCAWAPPYELDVTRLVHEGKNEVEIAVTSTWYNRLQYDRDRPEAERKTWTLVWPKKGALRPSGLLGPVLMEWRR